MGFLGNKGIFKIIENQLADLKNQLDNVDDSQSNSKSKTLLKDQISQITDSILELKDLTSAAEISDKTKENEHTELLQIKKKLENSKANLTSQIENSKDNIWSVDEQFKIVTINSNFKKNYKTAFGVDLIEGINVVASLPEPMLSSWKERYMRALKGEHFSVIDQFKTEGVPQYTETSFNPIKLGNKFVGVSCFSRDITKQKTADIALKESEQQFKTLVSNMPSVSYRCAMDKNWTMEFISNEMKNLSGYSPSDFVNNSVRSFASIIFPEDSAMVKETVLSGVKKKKNFSIKYRIRHKDGSIRWVSERGRAQYGKMGEVLWLDGVMLDITLQKNAEDALKESEEKYRTIFNTMTDVYIRTDLEGIIEIITPSIYEVLGYTTEEAIGNSVISIYQDPLIRENFRAKLMKSEKIRDFEANFIAKNGVEKTVAINASLIKNDIGEPIGFEGVARDITLRKIAEQSLRERTNELNIIFDNAPVILLLANEEGKVININRAGSLLSDNAKPEQIINLGGEVLGCINSYQSHEGCGNSDDCPDCAIRNTLFKTFDTKNNQTQIEGSLKIKFNGKENLRHFLISTTYIEFDDDKRVLISLDDITEIKEAQEQIRNLSKAVEQSTATIVITDVKGNIQYANPQFEKSTGYTVNEVIGKNPRFLKSRETHMELYQNLWQTILAGKTWQGEFLNIRKDGSQYWENAIISPTFDDANKIINFIAIKEDITDRKRIREELEKSETELRQINHQKSRFISILAHDLRGLVGSYHAYSDLICSHFETFSKEELKEQLSNLSAASKESLNLLDNLLEWGKASLGETRKSLLIVDLASEIDNVFKIMRDVANNKGVKLINITSTPFDINTDPNILQTILRNLINNGIKFTSNGGEIRLSYKNISDEKVEISVEDTGIGMNEETMKKLFKPGERVVREGTNDEVGNGLGLLICEEMVKRLDGNIFVESQENIGSRFFFQIPSLPKNQ